MSRRRGVIVFSAFLIAAVMMSCSALSSGTPGMPTTAPMSTLPDVAGTAPVDTGSSAATQDTSAGGSASGSPLAGDWTLWFQQSQMVVHVAPDGTKINSVDLTLTGWDCGGGPLTTSVHASSPNWAIQDNKLSMTVDLNPPQQGQITFAGTYDPSSESWSGSWEANEGSNHCIGSWDGGR